MNLQDNFLNQVRKDNVGVTIYLVSGVQLKGLVRGFDSFTIVLETPGKPAQLVYKHAMASVVPARPISFSGPREEGGPAEERAPAAEARPPVAEPKAPVVEPKAPAAEPKAPVAEAKPAAAPKPPVAEEKAPPAEEKAPEPEEVPAPAAEE